MDKDTDKDSTGQDSTVWKGLFEGMVREITGEEDYEFGDLAEKYADADKTSDYKYKFGDITKSIVAELRQTSSKDEKAQELRQRRKKAFEQFQNTFREKDLPIDVVETMFSRLDKVQRVNLIRAVCQLGAEGTVLWGLCTNLCTLFTVSISWIWALQSATPGMSLLLPPDKELWRTFVSKYTGLDLVLSPVYLIARAVMTLVGFRRYHAFVNQLSQTSFVTQHALSERRISIKSIPLQKFIAALLAFFITNIVLSGITAATVIGSITMVFRVCQRI
ncbi:expressed unknown protein [Seminavis robusta]|uniref:Uncharacterized protein n=1 Tax=Seminavis robusta TaxID=568900 RepID=A0A9N8ETS6_9STRA|nr:expressed unknown protein [Seminavis robusta]|eukprot:Sro1552_g281830.1 n/a (276) ;mRNA; r:18059-18886